MPETPAERITRFWIDVFWCKKCFPEHNHEGHTKGLCKGHAEGRAHIRALLSEDDDE